MNNDTFLTKKKKKKKVKIMTYFFFNDKEESMNNDTFLTNANVNIVQDTQSAERRHFCIRTHDSRHRSPTMT